MKRILLRQISDIYVLSALLNELLSAIAASPMNIHISRIAFEIKIPARVLKTLSSLHLEPENTGDICAGDLKTLIANILCRYPTIQIWQLNDGTWFIEF